MARTALARSKITTKSPQLSLVSGGEGGSASSRARRAQSRVGSLVAGHVREGTRGQGRVVVEVEGGITVYPARPGVRGTGGGRCSTRTGGGASASHPASRAWPRRSLWVVTVPELESGRVTQARSLDEIPATVADLVALVTGTDPADVEVNVQANAGPGLSATRPV
jgi:hypothetical protein